MKLLKVKNENDIIKDNPSIFFKLLFLFKYFGQKHDFSMLVSHKNLINEYFNERNMSNEKKEDC